MANRTTKNRHTISLPVSLSRWAQKESRVIAKKAGLQPNFSFYLKCLLEKAQKAHRAN